MIRALFFSACLLVLCAPAFAQSALGEAAPSATTQPAPSAPAFKASVDPAALALLNKAEASLVSAKSLAAQFTWTLTYPTSSKDQIGQQYRYLYTIRLMKPNFAFVDGWYENHAVNASWPKKPDHALTWASDGKTCWMIYNQWSTYVTNKSDPRGSNVQFGLADQVGGFFNRSQSIAAQVAASQKMGRIVSLKYLGRHTWNGAPYQVVEWANVPVDGPDSSPLKEAPDNAMIDTYDFYIGADSLIHCICEKYDIVMRRDLVLSDVQIDRPMSRESFSYQPPRGYHKPLSRRLLARNTQAPDFTTHDAAGKVVKLSDYRGKVILLDFWATWCDPCQAAMPDTNALAQEYKDKDVVVLAVNVDDTQQAFDNWLPQHTDYSALTFIIDTKDRGQYVNSLYHITAIPSEYVIDKKGRVVAGFVAGHKNQLEAALKTAGAS